MNNLKLTIGFSRKLQAEPHGGNKFESIDFSGYLDIPLVEGQTASALYVELKPELDKLYNMLREDAISKIKSESAVTVAEKPKSPFRRA